MSWSASCRSRSPICFRLASAQAGAFSAVLYVSPDQAEAVLFAFRTHLPPPAAVPPLRLAGLDPAAVYAIDGEAGARSGAAWMHAGLQLALKNFESTVRRIRRVAAP